MSWRDVASAAGLSYEALRSIRRGTRTPNAITRSRVEDALQWAPGSVEAVLADGAPTARADEPSDVETREELENEAEHRLARAEELFREGMAELARIREERQRHGGSRG